MSIQTKRSNSFAAARIKGRRQALGYIARDNIGDLYSWVNDLLFKDGAPRPYTFFRVYEYAGWRPEVKTGLRAESVRIVQRGESCAIEIADDNSAWSLGSRLETERGREEHELLRESMHVVISDTHLQVRLRTDSGFLAWWHIELEERPD